MTYAFGRIFGFCVLVFTILNYIFFLAMLVERGEWLGFFGSILLFPLGILASWFNFFVGIF